MPRRGPSSRRGHPTTSSKVEVRRAASRRGRTDLGASAKYQVLRCSGVAEGVSRRTVQGAAVQPGVDGPCRLLAVADGVGERPGPGHHVATGEHARTGRT